MKNLFLISLTILFSAALFAQSNSTASSEENAVKIWKTLVGIETATVYDAKAKTSADQIHYSEALQRLEGQEIEIKGYVFEGEDYLILLQKPAASDFKEGDSPQNSITIEKAAIENLPESFPKTAVRLKGTLVLEEKNGAPYSLENVRFVESSTKINPDLDILTDERSIATWKKLAKVKYKSKLDLESGDVIYTPKYSKAIKRLDGKEVSLTGYYYNLGNTADTEEAIIQAFPVHYGSCCSWTGPESMLSFEAPNVKIEYNTKITVKGRFVLNHDDPNKLMYNLEEVELYIHPKEGE
jgi:hypothetical protein